MFLKYYHLREQPFGVTPDPRFLYLSRTHREALASLIYGVEAERGFLGLVAQPGMGKTTLLFHLLEKLRTTARTAFVFNTQCGSDQLLGYLLADLGVDFQQQDLPRLHAQLNDLLLRTAREGRRCVFIVDEAQNLDNAVLETVRLLSNFETSRSKLLQIIVAGQPGLAEKLAEPSLVQFRQRISIMARLQPLSPAEVGQYIHHRLRVAGRGDQLFTPAAVERIAALSEGIPRIINNLCFNALSLGYALAYREIESELVDEAASDLSSQRLLPQHFVDERVPELAEELAAPAVPAVMASPVSSSLPSGPAATGGRRARRRRPRERMLLRSAPRPHSAPAPAPTPSVLHGAAPADAAPPSPPQPVAQRLYASAKAASEKLYAGAAAKVQSLRSHHWLRWVPYLVPVMLLGGLLMAPAWEATPEAAAPAKTVAVPAVQHPPERPAARPSRPERRTSEPRVKRTEPAPKPPADAPAAQPAEQPQPLASRQETLLRNVLTFQGVMPRLAPQSQEDQP